MLMLSGKGLRSLKLSGADLVEVNSRRARKQEGDWSIMRHHNWFSVCERLALSALIAAVLILGSSAVSAHPLGNFTVNHFTRIELANDSVKIHGVIDMAEIPTFQELQQIDTDGDGNASIAELGEYANRIADQLARQISLLVDGRRIPLTVFAKQVSLPAGAGGLKTLRIEFDLAGQFSAGIIAQVRELKFEDTNYADRIGWREIVARPLSGIKIFNSSAFGNGVSDELRAYPSGMLTAPLDERTAQLSFSSGSIPAGARPLMSRDGRIAQTPARDRLAELIAVPRLTPGLVLVGLLVAVVLGAVHALSPGHGKTVVGAYLIGSRGTARHAAFLGLTVTITHTAGVFSLGVATLLASEYVVPERLFPILSLVSGAIVVGLGFSLLIRRLRVALGTQSRGHTHARDSHTHDHVIDPTMPHSHGGRTHSHLPPGGDGSPVTWRSLLALGISGGILPCPSALVVLLGAISLHRVGYGLLLVVAFSLGLAGALTSVGLAFVYAGRRVKSTGRVDRLTRALPVFSALVITCAGATICYGALDQAGLNISTFVGQLTARLGTMTANAGP